MSRYNSMMFQAVENRDRSLGTKNFAVDTRMLFEILVAVDGFGTIDSSGLQWPKFLDQSLLYAQVSFFWEAFRERLDANYIL